MGDALAPEFDVIQTKACKPNSKILQSRNSAGVPTAKQVAIYFVTPQAQIALKNKGENGSSVTKFLRTCLGDHLHDCIQRTDDDQEIDQCKRQESPEPLDHKTFLISESS